MFTVENNPWFPFVDVTERERELFPEIDYREHAKRKIEFALHYLNHGFDWMDVHCEPDPKNYEPEPIETWITKGEKE